MTQSLFTHLNKHNIYNLLSASGYQKVTLPSIIPFLGLPYATSNAVPAIRCTCGWQGESSKARKHYLEVEGIAEVEFYCPSCSQYICFMAEPVFAAS